MVYLPLTIATLAGAALAAPQLGKRATQTMYSGLNIAGFDFGCGTDGSCDLADTDGPLASLGHADGISQMQHFVSADGQNIFRLPVAWQYLVNNAGDYATIDQNNFNTYNQLLTGCLNTGAKCIVDIHNYARWNGAIIGQGGPTNAQFAQFWVNLASKVASNENVIFGLMNEPHDLNINTWGQTVQQVVTAIRNAVGTNNIILLPGTSYTAGTQYINDGSLAALKTVTNPDSSYTNLVFDIHNYLDSDNSGTQNTCVTNNTVALTPLQQQLASLGRQALLSETGGGPDSSCLTYVCEELRWLDSYPDQFLGYIGWSAGAFDDTYNLNLGPDGTTDKPLVAQCFKRS